MIRCTVHEMNFVTGEALVSKDGEEISVDLGFPRNVRKRGLVFEWQNDFLVPALLKSIVLHGPNDQTHEKLIGLTVKPNQFAAYKAANDKNAFEIIEGPKP